MALNFDNEIPEWKNEGVEPSEELREKGFTGGYKPPATVFNWFWSKVQKCIAELQNKLKGHDEKLSSVEGDYLSKSKGGTVKGEVEFQKNVRVRSSHILGSEGGQTADIDFGYAGSLCLGLRDGNSTTSDWKSYIEFGQSSGIRSYSPSNNFNSLKGSYGLIASNIDNSDGSIIIASGCDGDYIENPSVAYSTLYNLFQSVSSYEDVDWDDVDKKLSAYGDIKILSSGDMFLLSNGDSMTLISKRGIKLFSDDMQTRAIGGSCTDIDSDFYEEINSKRYKSYHTKEHRIFAGGDMYLIPGHSGVDGNDTDGNHSVIVSNLKGKTSSSGVKPKITNFSDIHSANFEEGGENLIDKYNRKFFNVIECNTEASTATKEITIPDYEFVEESSNFNVFVKFINGSEVTGTTYIKVNGSNNSYEVLDKVGSSTLDDLFLNNNNIYVLEYEYDSGNEVGYFKLCGILSDLGSNYNTSDVYPIYGLVTGNSKDDAVIVNKGKIYHRNTSGYKHIPTGGDKGQVLVSTGVSGEVEWETLEAQSISVDDELSDTSINPVQNKVIKAELDSITAKIPANYAGSSTTGGAANSAVKLETKRYIDGVAFDGTSSISHIAVCSDAGSTRAKTVTISDFSLYTGASIKVMFNSDNTAESPTLNVNGTGAKVIHRDGGYYSDFFAGNIYELVYYGNMWEVVGAYRVVDSVREDLNYPVLSSAVYKSISKLSNILYVKANDTPEDVISELNGLNNICSNLTTAISNAYEGCEIVLLPGTYSVSSVLNISASGIVIRGLNSAVRDITVINTTISNAIRIQDKNYIVFKDLNIDETGSGNTSQSVALYNSNHITFDNIRFGGTGIFLGYKTPSTTTATTYEDISILNCIMEKSPNIYSNPITKARILNNYILSGNNIRVQTQDCIDNSFISGNNVEVTPMHS